MSRTQTTAPHATQPAVGRPNLDWMDHTACRNADPDLFFNNSRKAKAVCARCPVGDACRTFAARVGATHGTWNKASLTPPAKPHHASRRDEPNCQHGHPWASNAHYRRNGTRYCKECHNAAKRVHPGQVTR